MYLVKSCTSRTREGCKYDLSRTQHPRLAEAAIIVAMLTARTVEEKKHIL
jgi:hypothetical protein